MNKAQRESRGFSPRPQIASAKRRTWPLLKGLIVATVSSFLFSAATGVVLAAKRYLKRVPWSGRGMLVLAAAGSYWRVYVGVHYPTDVLAGVVGLWVACGWIEARYAVGTGSRLGYRAIRGKRAALVKRLRTVQYLDRKNKQE